MTSSLGVTKMTGITLFLSLAVIGHVCALPVFDEMVYSTIIWEEDAETPVQVLQISATGEDIWYSLQNTKEHYFTINPRTGEIELIKPLDRDERAVYHIVAMATENSGRGESTTADVIIGLYDINDRAPEFLHKPYVFSVEEMAATDTIVSTMTATDLDDPNELDHVSIKEYNITQNDDNEIFAIDSAGMITVLNSTALDREVAPYYEIVVKATDKLGLTGSATATIFLSDINDETPRFTNDLYYAELYENMVAGDDVYVVSAMDNDVNKNVTFFIVNGDSTSHFDIEAGPVMNTATVKLTRSLNISTDPEQYNLTLKVSDGIFESDSSLILRLVDANLYDPEFAELNYQFASEENAGTEEYIGTVVATDSDRVGDNSNITYMISENSEIFDIDGMTGVITLSGSLDREEKEQYNLTIFAVDHGSPPRTGTTLCTINVTDINDNAPTLDEHSRNALIKENVATQQFVITIRAIDADVDHGWPFSFTLSDENDRFTLLENGDGETANITTTNTTFDREEQAFYYLPITITDSGNMTETSTVTVVIDDMNDNPHSPGHLEATVYQYRGRSQKDGFVGKIFCNDPDDKVSGDKTFNLLTETDYFQVETGTGNIIIEDKTPEGVYQLTVEVSDDIHPTENCTAEINVKYFFEDIVTQTTTTRLEGSAEHFLVAGQAGRFVASLANIFKVHSNSVYIIGVQNVRTDSDNEVGVMLTSDNLFDVSYSVHGYQATASEAILGKNKNQIEEDVGIVIQSVTVNPCQDESTCPGQSCSVVSSLETSQVLMGAKNVSLSVPFTVKQTAVCECKAKSCVEVSCDMNPCFNGGTCFPTPEGGYRCACPEGYSSPRCQSTKRSFSGNSYAWYDAMEICQDSVIRIQFLTSRENGLIFYNGPMTTDEGDYIALRLVKGRPKLSIRVGSQSLDLELTESSKLSDGRWHLITILKSGSEIELMVNFCISSSVMEYPTYREEDTSTCRINGILDETNMNLYLNTPLQVGGIDSSYAYPTEMTDGFNGCIGAIDIDGNLYHLGNPAFQMNSENGCTSTDHHCYDDKSNPICMNGECMAAGSSHRCVCQLGYHGDSCDEITPEYTFGDGSYVQYTLEDGVANSRISDYQVTFRTKQSDATLGHIRSAEMREGLEYIFIELMNGYVTVKYDLGDGEHQLSLDSILVNDNTWHTVVVHRARSYFKIILDNGSGCRRVEGSAGDYTDLEVDKSSGVVIGARYDMSTGVIHGDFIGCMKDARFGKSYIGFGETIGKVAGEPTELMQGCTTPCTNNTCDDSEICLEIGDMYNCTCPPGMNAGDKGCTPVDPCDDDPCLNEGTCNDGDVMCDCTESYLGNLCQYESICYKNKPCNAGTCRDFMMYDYECDCDDGHVGKHCDIVNECASMPCMNGATCTPDAEGKYNCHCRYGFEGEQLSL
uniref:Neural-cadherin-like n=1 Tax=Saccoglossus kowalevskii TaxID=10224 RepID=A0ABM0M7U6_SACKO|nr:PREDICTED: neural-cadherin-like [Saccoglossus kowalevskii]